MSKPRVTICPPQNPETAEQWQLAVDSAETLRRVHDAKLYGLVVGGPVVDIERCDELLDRGRALGYTPSKDCVERFLIAWQSQPEATNADQA